MALEVSYGNRVLLHDQVVFVQETSSGIHLLQNPVPAQTPIRFEIEHPESPFALQLTDLNGKVVYKTTIDTDECKVTGEIPTSRLPAGTYFLSSQLGKKLFSTKVLIGR